MQVFIDFANIRKQVAKKHHEYFNHCVCKFSQKCDNIDFPNTIRNFEKILGAHTS